MWYGKEHAGKTIKPSVSFSRSFKPQADLTGSLSAGDIWANGAIKGRGIDGEIKKKKKGSGFYLKIFICHHTWCGCAAAGMREGVVCCKVRVEKYPKFTNECKTNDFAVAVISDWTAHDVSTSSLRERRCSSSSLLSDAQRWCGVWFFKFFFFPCCCLAGSSGSGRPFGRNRPRRP